MLIYHPLKNKRGLTVDTEEFDLFKSFQTDFRTMRLDVAAIKDETMKFMAGHEIRMCMVEGEIKILKPIIDTNKLFRNGVLAAGTVILALAALKSEIVAFFGGA